MSKEKNLGKILLDEMLEEAEKSSKKKSLLELTKAAGKSRWNKIKRGYLKLRKEVEEEAAKKKK